MWNCSLPASNYAEEALHISSGYGTTYQSMLRKLPGIYGQKSEQWHTEEFNMLPGREVPSLGRKQCFHCSALLPGQCSASPRKASRHRQPFHRDWAPSELDWDWEQTICASKETPRQKAFVSRIMIDLICSWEERGFKPSLHLSSLPNWRWSRSVSAFCEPETCNRVSGYETLTSCPLSLLAELSLHSTSSTFAKHSFNFQVTFWSPSMHRIFFFLSFSFQEAKH